MIPNVLIIICTYNEASNIRCILDKLKNYNVRIIDDNSPDGTSLICSEYLNVDVFIRKNERGIASAYVNSLLAAATENFDIIVQMDAGCTHNPDDIKSMIHVLRTCNADLVIGSRFINGVTFRGKRTILSLAGSFLLRFAGISVSDATSGFRVWSGSLLRKIKSKDIKSKGFAFQLEMLYEAYVVHHACVLEYGIPYMITNSSLNFKMIIEAAITVTRLILKRIKVCCG